MFTPAKCPRHCLRTRCNRCDVLGWFSLVTAGHFFTQTNNHTRTSFLSSVVSLNTASCLRCAANSLTLRATRIGLIVQAHPRAAAFHHLRRWSSATLSIVAVSPETCSTLSVSFQSLAPQYSRVTGQVGFPLLRVPLSQSHV